MFLFAAALAAPVAPLTSAAPQVFGAEAVTPAEPDCVHAYAASFHPDAPRCAPRLSEAAYARLDRRHRRTAATGFIVSGLGVPTFALGLTVTAVALYGGYSGWTAFGVNVMGVGLAAHAAGAAVGFRSLGLYDREHEALEQGRLRPEDLVVRRCNLQVRALPTGVGGRF